MPTRALRTDANQAAIVAAVRSVGARVLLLGRQIDALVWFRGHLYLVDFKVSSHAPRTPTQKALVADGWPLAFWSSVDEALTAIGAVRAAPTSDDHGTRDG